MYITLKTTNSPNFEPLVDLNLFAAMKAIGRSLETSVLQNYNQQRDSSGIPWLRSRAATERNGKTLIDTGAMMTSVAWWHNADTVVIGYPKGAQSEKERKHQLGLDGLPVRETLGLGVRDVQMIHKVIASHILNTLQATYF